ncbi:MAG: sulfatase-like hydrolase/transferase [Planctomycetes bacterium]|nr:sulfatase-like hydrolase/transferase [Planctomycetota bacterium]
MSLRQRVPFFLLGFVPLIWFDAWMVHADFRTATPLGSVFLLVLGALLGAAMLAIKPLHLTVPTQARQAASSAFALGLAVCLGAQIPDWVPGNLGDKLGRNQAWSLLLLMATLAVLYPLLARALQRLSMPTRPWLWFVLLVIPNLAYFAILDQQAFESRQVTVTTPLGNQPAEHKPNVVLVVFDTMRADTLLNLWNGQRHTPWLDQNASGARVFLNGYAGANTTPGGHATLLTGRYPAECGTLPKGETVLPASELTLAELLRSYGYRTVSAVTNARIGKAFGFGQGFEIYDDSLVVDAKYVFSAGQRLASSSLIRLLGSRAGNRIVGGIFKMTLNQAQLGRVAGDTTAKVLQAVDALERQPEEPVFLFVNFIDPHFPYDVREDLKRGFKPNYQNEELEAARRNTFKFHHLLEKDKALIRAGDTSPELKARLDWLQEAYREQYRELDLGFRDMMEGLRERGVVNDDTIVLITSDHAEHLGAHGEFMHGNTLYDDEVQVPFILSGLNVPSGYVEAPVSGVDFFPTVLMAMGVEPDSVPGLMGLPLQLVSPPDRIVRFESGTLRGFIHGKHKMIATDYGNRLEWTHAFDLSVDPNEEQNLIDQEVPWVEDFKADAPIQPSDDAQRITEGGQLDLGALGYTGEG